MEFFDILNNDGSATGRKKERESVHTNGDLHGTSHIWIVKKRQDKDGILVLLQRRSKNKDSFPGCLDTSSAGHIESGGSFLDTALRELREELGIKAEEAELIFMFRLRTHKEGFFHNKPFVDNQISNVYLLNRSPEDSEIKIQKSEIEEVVWQDYDYVLDRLKNHDGEYCIDLDEFVKLGDFLVKLNR